jgi:hypothetical protein
MKETKLTVVERSEEKNKTMIAGDLHRNQFFYIVNEGDKAQLLYCKEPSDRQGQSAVAVEIRQDGLFEYGLHDTIPIRIVSEVYIEWKK